MRQTFPFTHPKHKPAQALEALKHRIRKYLKRERRKKLPEGVDFWDFDCRIGPDEAQANSVHVADLIKQLDALAATGVEHAYVEILAKPGHRSARSGSGSGSESGSGSGSSESSESE